MNFRPLIQFSWWHVWFVGIRYIFCPSKKTKKKVVFKLFFLIYLVRKKRKQVNHHSHLILSFLKMVTKEILIIENNFLFCIYFYKPNEKKHEKYILFSRFLSFIYNRSKHQLPKNPRAKPFFTRAYTIVTCVRKKKRGCLHERM